LGPLGRGVWLSASNVPSLFVKTATLSTADGIRSATVNSRILRWTSVAVSVIALALAACLSTTPTATATTITIPDLTGQNAKIAEDKLEALGLTNVTLASATSKYTMVLAPQNWTVVSIEPAPGTAVSSTDTVIVKVTKP
jgi:hypothetical protein